MFQIRKKGGMVTYGAHIMEDGFIPKIAIETEGGHTVTFLADIVIPTNRECSDFCRAVCEVLANRENEPVETVGAFT